MVAGTSTFNFNPVGDYDDASFARLRELSVTYVVPATIVRHLRSRSASVTLSGRNLALWTKYRGVDPEVQTYGFAPPVATFAGAFFDQGGTPAGTYWIARVNLGL